MSDTTGHGRSSNGIEATLTGSPTEDPPKEFLAPGQVLGERYEVRSLLGRGGMGEVWRAFDLKLRVEVALKALRADRLQSERRREMLRREVRAARAVVSPNVCRIFDLIEVEGRELVSMEYVDGATLLDVLSEHGPMRLEQAQDVASQFLAGLEAIHAAGLVHRDVKPENIMLTRSGRVVVMDFGLARRENDGGDTVSGTPAYMSPEQSSGDELDARADVYAAGVVLAEMVAPEGVSDHHSRKSLWEAVRSDPPRVPETPWAAVIRRAVARDREQRPRSAHTMIRELEEVTLRVEGADDVTPYPGLSSFTEADAEYFFGRETEVEAMWARLESPARLLGLVGPSGAGKTSFLCAGVMPAVPAGWSVIRCTPGTAPTAALRRALVPVLGGDTDALADLAGGDDAAVIPACERWRTRHERALLVVDQFEELFTLSPHPTQESFAELLRRLPLEADVHVVLSMRDDFLMECHRHESLRPVVSDLMLLDPPTGANLRRALVQPATRCGYRFEDDALVDEMLAEVAGGRGALPLLAFAAAELWERRDREGGVLTREAYETIGGVGGALGRHAEAIIDRIGVERIPTVRELFRNLVTAEGTRAVRGWDELLSVFGGSRQPSSSLRASGDSSTRPSDGLAQNDGERGVAQEVLRELIDARLLTSYEVKGDDEAPTRHVEIIHESLLANWPRLVRWQTQDADAAQLRDQLRQAARTWEEHERSDDLLWTGAAYRQFAVWRESYAGGLSATEQAFADAMARHAARAKRRRRIIAAALLTAAAAVAAVTTILWRRGVVETRRAQAAHLRGLGQLEPSSSLRLAYAMASLELRDDPETRLFALRTLWREPTELRLPEWVTDLAFSPDGRWALVSGHERGIELWPRDGGDPIELGHSTGCGAPEGLDWFRLLRISPESDRVGAYCRTGGSQPGWQYRIWPLEAGAEPTIVDLVEEEGDILLAGVWDICGFESSGERLLVKAGDPPEGPPRSWRALRGRVSVDGGEVSDLEELVLPLADPANIDIAGCAAAGASSPDGHLIYHASVGAEAELVGRQESKIVKVWLSPDGERIATLDVEGRPRIWLATPSEHAFQTLSAGSSDFDGVLTFSADGALLLGRSWTNQNIMWNLTGPPDADPVELGVQLAWGGSIDPTNRWLVLKQPDFRLRPLRVDASFLIHSDNPRILGLVFDRAGDHLFSADLGASILRWPLTGESGDGLERLYTRSDAVAVRRSPRFHRLAIDPEGRFLAAAGDIATGPGATIESGVTLVPLDGGGPVGLVGSEDWPAFDVAIDPEGRRVAAGAYMSPEVRIWELESGAMSRFELEEPPWPGGTISPAIGSVRFLPDGRLLISTLAGSLWRLDPATGETERAGGEVGLFDLSADGRFLLSSFKGRVAFHDLLEGTVHALASHSDPSHDSDDWTAVALDPTGTVAISANNRAEAGRLGVVRVGPATGEEPHLLFGPPSQVRALAVSPDGGTIAAATEDGTIQLWPMPDVAEPALHTLPLDELLARLGASTNARVVRDDALPEGYRVEWQPITRWPTHPED